MDADSSWIVLDEHGGSGASAAAEERGEGGCRLGSRPSSRNSSSENELEAAAEAGAYELLPIRRTPDGLTPALSMGVAETHDSIAQAERSLSLAARMDGVEPEFLRRSTQQIAALQQRKYMLQSPSCYFSSSSEEEDEEEDEDSVSGAGPRRFGNGLEDYRPARHAAAAAAAAADMAAAADATPVLDGGALGGPALKYGGRAPPVLGALAPRVGCSPPMPACTPPLGGGTGEAAPASPSPSPAGHLPQQNRQQQQQLQCQVQPGREPAWEGAKPFWGNRVPGAREQWHHGPQRAMSSTPDSQSTSRTSTPCSALHAQDGTAVPSQWSRSERSDVHERRRQRREQRARRASCSPRAERDPLSGTALSSKPRSSTWRWFWLGPLQSTVLLSHVCAVLVGIYIGRAQVSQQHLSSPGATSSAQNRPGMGSDRAAAICSL